MPKDSYFIHWLILQKYLPSLQIALISCLVKALSLRSQAAEGQGRRMEAGFSKSCKNSEVYCPSKNKGRVRTPILQQSHVDCAIPNCDYLSINKLGNLGHNYHYHQVREFA